MRFQDKVETYKNRLTGQNVDDMLCRRIWHGMGLSGSYSSQRMGELEKRIVGHAEYRDLDIKRIMDLVTYCIGRNKEWPWMYETLEITKNEDVQERISHEVPTPEPLPLFLVRLKSSTTTLAYALFPKDRIGTFFTPPYHVIKGDPVNDFVIQDVETFIRQFGPYEFAFEGV